LKVCLRAAVFSFLTLMILGLTGVAAPPVLAGETVLPVTDSEVKANLATVQIPFVQNEGQVGDEQVKYYAQTFAGTVFVTDEGIVYNLPRGEEGGWVMKEEFAGGNALASAPSSAPGAPINYYLGSMEKHLSSYQEITLGEVYDKIKVNLKAYGNNVEKIFTVAPGGDPDAIVLKVAGVDGLSINAQGELELVTGLGTVKMTCPMAYQVIDGQRVDVAVAYVVENDTYGFAVGEYDHACPLVIDPLLAATFLGGSGTDSGYSIALDKYGYVYVAGTTNSTDFPGTTGNSTCGTTNGDVFVAKLSPDLTRLLAATYLGGSYLDSINENCLAVAPSGEVYLAGNTKSSDFPHHYGSYTGGKDVFVAELKGDLSQLIASTIIGGETDESPTALAVDTTVYEANVFIAGTTLSSNYPTTAEAYKLNHIAGSDVFITKLPSNLATTLASTVFGGDSADNVTDMALDPDGNVYIVGDTAKASTPYPVTPGTYSRAILKSSISMGFISKLDNNLTSLIASTYVGSTAKRLCSMDYIRTLALHKDASDGKVYVYFAGYTGGGSTGTGQRYPVTTGAYLTTPPGNQDGFVSKMDSDLTSLIASTFVGGSGGNDNPKNIALDSGGNVYITGYTNGSGYPTTDGTAFVASNDGFVSKMNSSLTSLIASTLVGGSGDDMFRDMTLDTWDNIHLIGFLGSDGMATPGVCQSSLSGTSDAFISKLTGDLTGGAITDNTAPVWVDGNSLTVSNPTSSGLTLTWTPAIDNVGVVSYRVYQNDALACTVSCATNTAASGLVSYNLTGLNENTTYTFGVEAIDANNNPSTGGPTASGTTLVEADITVPYWTGGSLTPSNLSATGVTLTWSGAADNKGVTGYQITDSGSVVATVYGETTCNLTNLTLDTEYNFKVQALDASGNISTDGPGVNVTTLAELDTVAPYWTITGASEYTDNTISPTQTYFKWPAALDNVGVTGYNVYIKNPPAAADYSVVATVFGQTDCIITLPDTPGITYPVSVRAFDAAGNLSPYSLPGQICAGESYGVYLIDAYLTAITGNPVASSTGASIEDSTSVPVKSMFKMAFKNNVVNNEGDDPVWPGNQQCFKLQTVTGSVYAPLNVTMVPDTISFTERNNIFVTPVNQLLPNTQYKLIISPDLMPKNKKRSMMFERVVNFTTEAAASGNPAWSSGGTMTASNPTPSGVTLTWTPADAGAGVTSYAIIKNNSEIIQAVDSTTTSYDVTGLAPGTNYTFQVQAFNSATNWTSDGPSATATTTADTAVPTWPSASLTESNVAGHGLTLTWSAASDDGAVTGYQIYRDGTPIATVSTLTYNVTGLTAETSYTFKVEAGDAAGNWTTDGPSLTVTTTVYTGGEVITGAYSVTPAVDAAYTSVETADGIDTMTVNAGYSGSRSFTVDVSPVTAHDGNEKAVFVQIRDGAQLNLNASAADFDAVNTASASFEVQPGDVIKAFVVDDLYTTTEMISTVLEQ